MNIELSADSTTRSKLADLLQKTSSTAHQIIAEELNYIKAVQNKVSHEQVEIIKDKIKSLKRKLLLFNQVAKMLGNKS